MIKKRRVFLAMFLALAVMLQYSFMPQTFMSYAEESSEGRPYLLRITDLSLT